MKIETLKAFIKKNQPQITPAMVDGEYFYLSPELTDSLEEFALKADDLCFKSIKEIPLPFDKFAMEIPCTESDVGTDPIKGLSITKRMFNFYRNHSENTLHVTIVENVASPDGTKRMGLPYYTQYVFVDPDFPDWDSQVLYWGRKDWEISYGARWNQERDGDPAFGICIQTWHPDKKFQEKYYAADDDLFDENIRERELYSGPEIAAGGITIASALSCIKTGVSKTKMSCSIIPTKKAGKKANKSIRKHYFTTLTLDALEQVSSNQIVRRAGVSAHTVRGHFKKTKTGVFWWSPFVRGSGKVKQREAYVN